MNLYLKRLDRAIARREILIRKEADLHAQFLELVDLREQLREAQLSTDLQHATRTRTPAPGIVPAVA
jgi:hypothetical protein